MAEITNADEWLKANDVTGPERLQQVYEAARVSGRWGAFTGREDGGKAFVEGPASTLVLPDVQAKQVFLKQIEELMGLDAGW